MNYKLTLKILAIVAIIISLAMIIPTSMALYYNEINSFQSFLKVIIPTIIISFIMFFFLKNIDSSIMLAKDGFLFVTLSWILVSFLGGLPYFLSGAIPSFADAFFESISGFTTTGASICSNIESLPRSILFWRSLTHWFGGMGIVVLTVAILPILGIGGLQLLKAEAPGPTVDKITPRIKETAKILWLLYLGFTVAETILLLAGGLDLFDALTHTFGTLATGGFSTKNQSISHFNSAYIDGVITLFMVLAGISFTLHFRLLSGRVKYLFKDTELKAYFFIFITATIIMTINLYGSFYKTFSESLRYASFQAATILTTTGFATADFELWPKLSQTILFTLMFVGGCSGSTGGGIKVVRVITLLKQGLNEMKFLLHPRGIFSLKINNNSIRKNVVYAISGFFFLYILMLIFITLIVSSSGQNIITSFTTALATVGNIGPGFGKIGPTENYAFYPDYVKWFLSFAMLVGRLELYTVLVLFTPHFWRK